MKEKLLKQYKRIKELEEMQKAYKEISYNETLQTFELNNIKSENQQLKKQLHDLPKKIIEEINEELHDCGRTYIEDEPYIEICIVKGILARIYRRY